MVEEEKIKVHILGYNEEFITAVCSRINKLRPVDICCYFDIKEFLSQSIESRPDMVAVSMSVRHPTINQLPQIFTNALKCPVILFIEVDDMRSRSLLSACNSDFKINGLLTAHNLWMKIRHCQESQSQSKNELDKIQDVADSTASEKDDDLIILRGSKFEPVEDLTKSKLSYLLKANQRDGSDSHSDQFSETTEEKKTSEQAKNDGFIADIGQDKLDQNQREVLKGSTEISNPDSITDTDKVSESNLEQSNTLSPIDTNFLDKEKHQEASDALTIKSIDHSNIQEKSQNEDENKVAEGEPKIKEKKTGIGKTKRNKSKKAIEEEKIILECSQSSAKQLLKELQDNQNLEALDSGVGMIAVKMNHSAGCLLIRARADNKLPEEWFDKFRNQLLRQLKASGYESQISPYYSKLDNKYREIVETKDKFSNEEDGEDPNFLFTVHDYEEPELPLSMESGLLELDPQLIKPGKILYFDVYIYLPKNKKNVRYVREGGFMSEEQARRLEQSANGKKVYVAPDDELKLRRFLLEISVESDLEEKSAETDEAVSNNNKKAS
jgi:hypothetical protein